MLGLQIGSGADAARKALDRAAAIVEYDLAGQILNANASFCRLIGYSLAELKGRQDSLFVAPSQTGACHALWDGLRRGEPQTGVFQRIAKGGREIFIQAAYSPVPGPGGRVQKILALAMDVTADQLKMAELSSVRDAISRSQAMIEFTPTGEIVTANDNFLQALGYRLDEIKGRHHRMFVDPAYVQSAAYADFWSALGRGEYVSAEFQRLAKGGEAVWIQASYNPVFDAGGKVVKVIKVATDVTPRVKAVKALADGLGALAANNLGHRLRTQFDPAFEPLRADFNQAVSQLQTALRSVVQATSHVSSGSDEIANAAEDLSKRTEQQAASLEQTAAALDQITATVRRSAEAARQAATSASDAKRVAEKSGAVMHDAVGAMSEIEASARQISQIIGVIDEIAFQTNLLALNAGVEAARAGDAGRGFAVVAQEVRALAQRSADAAKQIKSLISTSAEQVERGVRLVGQTGAALSGIVDKVSAIDDDLSEMTRASQEQSSGLHQVNSAVNHMDQVTQQNAAMVEQTAAAAAGLRTEAKELAMLIHRFDVGDGIPARVA